MDTHSNHGSGCAVWALGALTLFALFGGIAVLATAMVARAC